MTNREKYNFDYFTIGHYRKIVELAISEGFNFIHHSDEYVQERKEIIWRHDVEFSPDIALNMAEIEHECGVSAIYFFQLHSRYYNTLDSYFTDILFKIKNLGHEIGLHFDAHYYNIQSEDELNHFIELDRRYFEGVFGFPITTFSFHNTNPFILSCQKSQYGGLINVYSSYFKEHYNYCADSTGYWRFEILDEVLRDPTVRHLQVLTHDAMWSTEVLSPRKRVRKSIQDNADRIMKGYDDFFLTSPAHNIDD